MSCRFAALLASNAGGAIDGNGLTSFLAGVGRLFYFALISAIVILLAYYCTKLIGSARLSRVQNSRNNLKIIESIGIGLQSSIQLVKAGEKYMLIAVTKDKISFLTEVDVADLDLSESNVEQIVIPFEKYLRKFIQKDKTHED